MPFMQATELFNMRFLHSGRVLLFILVGKKVTTGSCPTSLKVGYVVTSAVVRREVCVLVFLSSANQEAQGDGESGCPPFSQQPDPPSDKCCSS